MRILKGGNTMRRNNKQEDFVICEECKIKKEKADCHLNDKISKMYTCHKCFMKDNNIDDDIEEDK